MRSTGETWELRTDLRTALHRDKAVQGTPLQEEAGSRDKEGEAATVTACRRGSLERCGQKATKKSHKGHVPETTRGLGRNKRDKRSDSPVDRTLSAVSRNRRPPMAWWEKGPWMRPRLRSGEDAEPRGAER